MSTEDEKLLKEAKKLPWEDRLVHKNWKVRNDANIDLAALCDSITDPKDPRLREFGSFFRKTVADSNAPVQEKALDALISFLKAADADVGRYAKEVCDAVVAKCLTGRPKTVEKSQMVFMLWVELEAVDAFLDAMEKAIKNKVAKAVVPAIDVMFQALSEFGAKIVPPKRILKMLPELFDHQDQNVRASSKGLTLELCRWIGKEPVKSILFEKMRDTMKKELEAELVNVSGTARPSRKIRSEQDKEPEQEAVPEVVGSGPSEESVADAPQEIDEYELVDPVDILTPLEKTGFWDGVKAAKWSERKEAVAELTKLASTKRIAPGDFTEICRTLKKLIIDVNIAVAVEAIQAIGNLAKGLRTHFSGNSRFLLPILLEKLKEKKPTLTEALSQTLQAMYKSGCLNLADIVEDVKAATKNKVPLVRSSTLNWVSLCIETSNKAIVLKLHKEYVPICMECLNDGTPEVRDAAFSALAAVAKLVGMRPLEKSLEKLDDVRKKKLSEMIGSSGTGPVGTSSATLQTSGGSSSAAEASEGAFVRRSAASMLSGKKPVQSAPASKKGGAVKAGISKKSDAAGQLKSSKLVESEDVEPADMSLEEIESRLGSLIQAETISQLKSAVWKERLEAITSFKEQVEATQELDQSVEILIRLLCAVPGWSEKNVQVQQQVIEVITHIGSTASKFPKKCVVLCLGGISERVADIKTRTQAMKCLTIFSEAVGPGFIFDRLYKIMKEHKNPKVLSEGILWMVSAIEDFGVSHLKLKDLIDFCKDTGLQSSAAATRNATIKLIGALHKFVGPDIKGFLSDVKPALLSAVEAECEKNPFEGASLAPKKTVKVLESASSLSGGGLDSLPREDISGKITPTLLKGLESPDWKVRLESIEGVNRILEEANKRIQPTGTVELFGALRGRLYDSNKNLVTQTLSTVGAVALAMGPAVEKASKGILSDVLKCLGDNKKNMRESTLTTLDAWLAAVHLDKVVPYVTTALTEPKLGAEGRKDLFDWVSRQLTGLTDFADAVHLLKPTASAMTDKSADVRKAAEVCLGDVLRVCGQELVTKNLRDLQGPALAIVLERLKPNGAFHETSMGPAAKNGSKVAKSNANGYGDRTQKHGSKAVSSRGVSTKGSRADLIMSVQDITIQSQALLNVKESNKDERERLVVRRFKFEEPRLEQIQDLENDLMKYFREDLHRRLLSTDFKKQVDGIEMLHKALPSIGKEVIEVIDILLRWFVLRFCESNTSCLLKVLEFLPELFDMLRIEGYTMTESEAAIFLPCLIEKSGHNIEKVREKMRELAKQVIHSYSAAKTFPYVLEGLRSRNNRTRIESVDLIGFLIDSHGSEVSGQLKSLQVVASLTAERDGEIRKAALNALATGYKILGDDIWRYVGKLTDAQRSMLDDRFKWKAREMDKRKEGKPGEARAVLRRSVRENGSDVAEQSGDVSRSLSGPIFTRDHSSELHMERPSIPRVIVTADGPMDWNEALDIIQSGSPEQSVEGMKFICNVLVQATSNPEDSAMDDIVKDADRLVSCLANKVAKTFDFSIAGASSRSCKYVLNTLMQTFQNKRLADAVKESTLNSLVTELLLWLLDERVPRMDDGGQLLKALNVLMLKILDNAERTSSFVVLINLLRPLDPSRWPSSETKESLADRNTKFSDLVVKCLIKLTKFNARESDWGFTSFMPLGELNDPSRGYLVNDTVVVEADVAIHKFVDCWSHDSKKETGYVGLKNQGATGYMNSLLQTLYHIPYFRKAVYHMPTIENDMPSGSIPLALQSLFYKLQYRDTSVATKELTKSFGWGTNDSFLQHDVQEFNRVLCEKLEDKMKGTVVEGAIQQLFEGHHMNYIECINVDYKSTIKESFYDLQLDVKGCRDVYASFDKYVEVERLEGDNKYHAEQYGLQEARKGVLFIDFPPVLQLQLKRFEYDFMRDTMVKINDLYEFPLQLDLDIENGKYLSPDADRSVRNLYTLHSVLVHSDGVHGGHYYAYIRPTLSDQWFKFDDERLTKEDIKRALEEQYGGEEELLQTNPGFNSSPFKFTKYSNAYMLVYIRESDKEKIICNVDEKDIAEHLRIRLKKEQEENEQKRKEKAEALLYTIIKVARDEDLLEQIGRDIYFDLVDHEKVHSFRIHKQTPFNLFKEEVAKELGVPVQCQHFWFWAKRQNYTYRLSRPLTPQEGAQSVGELREVSNKANNAELKLFLEVEYGQDLRPIPPPIKSKEDILLFFKHYNPLKEELRYVGRLLVKGNGKPLEILTKLNELAGFSRDEEVELFEEIKFEPNVMCERIDKKLTFRGSQLENGDIICFQKSPQAESSEQCRYPDVPSFLEYVHNRQVVHFRSLEKPKEDEFCLELSKLHNYDDVVQRVALQLDLDDPSKIRLTAHNCNSQQPKPQPIKYRGVKHLSDMLVHYNQTSDILYYEVLDIPLPELQGLKTLKVAFHHSTKDEVVINTIRLPKQSTVGDVINDLKTKVELSHPNAELRLLEVFYHKIYKIFPLNEKIENINDQYWTLRAEEIPEEEKNLGPHDRLIHVYHFMKDTAQNQVVQNFGEPFLLVIREGETLAEVKVHIQKKLQVPEEEFLKWKFAFSSLGHPDYLQDSDIVSKRFQRLDVYGAWDQYLGLEHSGKVRFLSCWVSSEAFLLLEKIHQVHNGTFVKFSMEVQALRTMLLESFASFIVSMSSTKVNDVSKEALQLAAISIRDFERVGLDLWWLKKRLGEAKTVKKYSESVNTLDSCGSALEVARGDLQVARCAFEVALAKVRELEEGLANAKAEVEVMSSRELPKSVGVNDFVLKDMV